MSDHDALPPLSDRLRREGDPVGTESAQVPEIPGDNTSAAFGVVDEPLTKIDLCCYLCDDKYMPGSMKTAVDWLRDHQHAVRV